MGKTKHLPTLENLFNKSLIVKYSSIRRVVKSDAYSKQIIRNLILKGRVKKLSKGCYTKYDDPSLLVLCFKEAYLGLQDAVSFRGLWEQETIPIILTTAKVRTGIRKVLGSNVLIRKIDKKYFFGFDFNQYSENIYLPYSDNEKTLIDLFYYNENLSKDVLREFRAVVDVKRLNRYLSRYPKKYRDNFKKKFNFC